jgi:hypothetical protein
MMENVPENNFPVREITKKTGGPETSSEPPDQAGDLGVVAITA